MKRSFPFDDLFLNQSKMHIGEKEVNQGVNRAVNMQSVYGKGFNGLSGRMPEFYSSALTFPAYNVWN